MSVMVTPGDESDSAESLVRDRRLATVDIAFDADQITRPLAQAQCIERAKSTFQCDRHIIDASAELRRDG